MAKRICCKKIPPALAGMVRQYIETALWSTTDNTDDSGGEPLDRNYGPEDISVRFHNEAVDTCTGFIAAVTAMAEHEIWQILDLDDEDAFERSSACRRYQRSRYPSVETCLDFLSAYTSWTGLSLFDGQALERVGHDLWLTQNHHGAGFWDGDYERGDELTAIAHTFGRVDPYVWRGRVTV